MLESNCFYGFSDVGKKLEIETSPGQLFRGERGRNEKNKKLFEHLEV